MSITLQDVFHSYLSNKDYLEKDRIEADQRMAAIPAIQRTIRAFTNNEMNLDTFRQTLSKVLNSSSDWGATGFGFMMELNKLAKYHCDTSDAPAIFLRDLLTDLNAGNEGERIEQLYNFLLSERPRLVHEGKTGNKLVAPRNSAFIISLFAFWLDPDGNPIIYYDSVRKGIYLLVKAGMLNGILLDRYNPLPREKEQLVLRTNNNAVEVINDADHQNCKRVFQQLGVAAPYATATSGPYWIERFLYWVTDHLRELTEPSNALIKEDDESNLQAKSTQQLASIARESEASYIVVLDEAHKEANLSDEPLRAIAEPLLTRLIREVQKRILIEEHVVRRIYHALLARHVILSGPPGTGKTELARLIPEILWQSEVKDAPEQDGNTGEQDDTKLSAATAYTTRLVTATDDWTPRTLISGIVPSSSNGRVAYKTQLGHLAATILKNWAANENDLNTQSTIPLQRKPVTSTSGLQRGTEQQYRGLWLVIDEFNRAPIDLALGEAMTTLSINDHLRVAIDGGSAELPIPQDFRIIGTLNSFDRNYLNQISEALKRRFSFIEILPPTRAMRAAEQGIVLYKALQQVSHLTQSSQSQQIINIDEAGVLNWNDLLSIGPDETGAYSILWNDDEQDQMFRVAFEAAWDIFEVIRVYRQLGTAQAITLMHHMLIAGILQSYTTRDQWLQALDAALCDTVADQLQVLLPDELTVLLLYLTSEPGAFQESLQHHLNDLGATTHNRLYRQLLAFGNVTDEQGDPYLTDAEIEHIASQASPTIPSERLAGIFHPMRERYALPQFTRRLRTFKAERGL